MYKNPELLLKEAVMRRIQSRDEALQKEALISGLLRGAKLIGSGAKLAGKGLAKAPGVLSKGWSALGKIPGGQTVGSIAGYMGLSHVGSKYGQKVVQPVGKLGAAFA